MNHCILLICVIATLAGGCLGGGKVTGNNGIATGATWSGDNSIKNVRWWVDKLESSNPAQRAKAARELGEFGADAETALPKLKELERADVNEEVREAARKAILKIR